jgi:protein-disulfide isomerase
MIMRAVRPSRRAMWLGFPVLLLVLGLALSRGRGTRTTEPYDFPGIGHEKGNPAARIVIIEFADFGCSACALFAEQALPQIEREWIATGRARIRVIPLGVLRLGRGAGQAAECASRQGAFWPMHDLLYARRQEWIGRRGQRARFEGWATELGMNAERFRACLKSDPGKLWLKRNTNLAQNHGVPGTPAFVVNGRAIVGALPYRDFAAALEAAQRPPHRNSNSNSSSNSN